MTVFYEKTKMRTKKSSAPEKNMSSLLTALVVVGLLLGLTYMAKDLVGKNRIPPPEPTRKRKRKKDSVKLLEHQAEPVATQEELLQFWTKTMNDKTLDVETRLRASELIGMFYLD